MLQGSSRFIGFPAFFVRNEKHGVTPVKTRFQKLITASASSDKLLILYKAKKIFAERERSRYEFRATGLPRICKQWFSQ